MGHRLKTACRSTDIFRYPAYSDGTIASTDSVTDSGKYLRINRKIKIQAKRVVVTKDEVSIKIINGCLLYTSPSPRDRG